MADGLCSAVQGSKHLTMEQENHEKHHMYFNDKGFHSKSSDKCDHTFCVANAPYLHTQAHELFCPVNGDLSVLEDTGITL